MNFGRDRFVPEDEYRMQIDLPRPIPEDPLPYSAPLRGTRRGLLRANIIEDAPKTTHITDMQQHYVVIRPDCNHY